ncbi:MAG TPA: uroporphyrinogen-III C-methyltransferase [Candidatus Acidoferrum sp.]|nr:uroporphyrinogen-III C-methyltransferase [Candidatus Acidoferrum sp.]
MSGKVYLVGAGPGDPELLTLKALRLLRSAEVVLHDDLITSEILKLISPVAQVQNVGKRCGSKTIRQEEINFLMVALASSGRQVVRLKSGDPLIFGRAGEEIEALRQGNVEYEIVPGVTSALGAAASAGIPLTHRHASSTLVLTTGSHASDSRDKEWAQYAAGKATLVVYMPGQNYVETSVKLKAAGFAEETPCAVISRATTPQQRTLHTTVADLRNASKLTSPTLLIVGDVVRFADQNSIREIASFAAPQGTFASTMFASAKNTGRDEELA